MDPELKKRVEQSMYPVPGPWKSMGSENEIGNLELVPKREKITCRWELSPNKLQRRAKFDHSDSKSMKNQYVGFESRPNEKNEIIGVPLKHAIVQTTEKRVNVETQTNLQIKNNKCIQTIEFFAEEEEIFQLQSFSNNIEEPKNIESIHFYKTPASKNQSVSYHTWHPTIPGVFATSYMANCNEVNKTVNLDSSENAIESANVNQNPSSNIENVEKIKVIPNYEDCIMERANNPQLRDEYLVHIWSIDDNMFPKLTLSSPEEVCCVKFSPRNGNTVVGGLMNGQICIWDISGKLDKIDSNDSIISNNEKKHHRNLWIHMQRLLTKVDTKIRATALSAVIESHESMVTEIQWIHPMNEVTSLGKLVAVKDEQFSDQFFSASSDGTIKLWDLHSMPMPISKKTNPNLKNIRFPHPDKLDSHKSRLRIYNNRFKPSYTMKIMHPETNMCSPITAMSFGIPLAQYKYTSNNEPLVIGMSRQFEYVPTAPSDANHTFIVGNIFGQIRGITWNNQPDHNNESENIWWGHVHEGPITSIMRNVFYEDVYLVSGGHVVSIWNVNYKDNPIWWKRFTDTPNSVLWSNNHPAEFRVSFNTTGVLQFWNFMKYYNKPYYELNTIYVANDKFKGTLSTPNPSLHHIDAKQLQYLPGISEVLNYKKHETIAYSDSNGMISLITVNTIEPKKDEIEEVGRLFREVVIARHEVDTWNKNYIETSKKNKDIKIAKKVLDESKKRTNQEEMKIIFDDLHSFAMINYEAEKEKLNKWIQNNPVKELDWEKIIELEIEKDKEFENELLKISTMKKLVVKYGKKA